MRAAIVIAAALFAAPTAASPIASADEPVPDKARQLATRGRELHDRGDYDRAIVAFKEAYIIAPSPALLFNLAQAYRLQGNCDDASLMYRRFLRTGPDEDAQRIAEGHLATVERCVAKRGLGIHTDETLANLSIAPPLTTADAILRDDPRPAPGQRKQQIGLGLGVAGAVGLAGAIYFGVQAASDASEVEEAYANGAKWKDIMDLDERGKQRATYAKIFGVAGGLAALSGVALYMVGSREERASQITVAPTTGGAQVSVGWRF